MKDIALKNRQLEIQNGDFVTHDSLKQHQELILTAQKGSFRNSPTLGVGLIDYLNDENLGGLSISIKKEFAKDGMKVKKVGFGQGELKIELDETSKR